MKDFLSAVRVTGGAWLACMAVFGTVRADELQNAAQTSYGATASFSGAPNNKSWPAVAAIPPENPKARNLRGGCLFGAPMKDGTISVRLLTPCSIRRVDLMQLDYHDTMNVRKVEIAVDGRPVKTVELEEKPAAYQEIPLQAEGQTVSVKCLDTFPARVNAKTGKTGPNYGGWARVRVMVCDDMASRIAAPATYRVELLPEARTPTGTAAGGTAKVVGEPRVAKGHPRTTWDAVDVARYRSLLKTSPEFKTLAEQLRKGCDARIRRPTGVPQPQKGPDGKWLHVSDGVTGKVHNGLALDIANLGTAYQLFGDEKYAEYARRLLLDYAEAWPNYGVGARAGFSHDPSKVFDQRLSDATWLIQVAVGFDFVRSSKCFSAEDIRKITDDLVAGSARFIRQNRSHLISATNWSAIGTAACLAAGVACDDEDLVNTALWGHAWSSLPEAKKDLANFPKWWLGEQSRAPQGIELHFSQKCIDVDGMWCEGAMGYQFMALQALVFDAEVLWHMGIDLYRYRDCALKCIFDSPILFAYPNYVTPAIHDSGNASIVGREAGLYEYGYLRYGDPSYLPILRRVSRRLGASFQQFTVSCLYDIGSADAAAVENPSVDLNGVGYAVLRSTDECGTRNLLLDYGPNRSHGHPDKLNLDLWAFGNLQVRDPGTVWYENQIYRAWYRTTFAHNTLSVDMQEQQPCGAELLCFAPGDGVGIMRARTADAYPGVMMDRTLVLTRDYVADVFGAFASMPRTYDLAWHPSGKAGACSARLQPFDLPQPRTAGYSELRDLQAVKGSDGVSLRFENKGLATALHLAASSEPTMFVIGSARTSLRDDVPPETAVFERRVASETAFGNVFDLSGTVKSVRQTGDVRKGPVALQVECAKSRDTLWVGFGASGSASDAQVRIDAQVAFLSVGSGDGCVRTIALSGGRSFAAGSLSLKLAVPGGAIAERTPTGSWLVRNCSSVANEIAVKVPDGERTFKLAPGASTEWLVKGARPLAEHKASVLKKLAAEAAAAEAKAKAEQEARVKALKAAAASRPGRAGTKTAVEAEAFAAQGGGEVLLNDRKIAVHGSCIYKWDSDGQWLEWKVNVPADGYYHVTFCYCSDAPRHRQLVVNGEAVPDTETQTLPGTGGFSGSSDDWRLFTFQLPDGSAPLPIRFRAGENTLRSVNVGGGGCNLDYLYITSSDVIPERMK